MAKAVHQFRFYEASITEDRNEPNCPSQSEKDSWLNSFANGDVFKDYYPFYQLGIQTIPGTTFYLNGSEDPIIVGSTGIYEIDASDGVEIYNLAINSASLSSISAARDGYIIIDVLYETGGGGF